MLGQLRITVLTEVSKNSLLTQDFESCGEMNVLMLQITMGSLSTASWCFVECFMRDF